MCHLTLGIYSEKCVIKRHLCCANITKYTYIKVGSEADYTPCLYGVAIAPRLQACTSYRKTTLVKSSTREKQCNQDMC